MNEIEKKRREKNYRNLTKENINKSVFTKLNKYFKLCIWPTTTTTTTTIIIHECRVSSVLAKKKKKTNQIYTYTYTYTHAFHLILQMVLQFHQTPTMADMLATCT